MKNLFLTLFLTASLAQADEPFTCELEISGYDISIQDSVGTVYCERVRGLYSELEQANNRYYDANFLWSIEKSETQKKLATLNECETVRDEYIKGFYLAVEYLRESKAIIVRLRRKLNQRRLRGKR